eukprot:2801000-Rhodomonas_salina.2
MSLANETKARILYILGSHHKLKPHDPSRTPRSPAPSAHSSSPAWLPQPPPSSTATVPVASDST